jgi:adenine-specific DNA-methyltransferase
MDGTSLTPEQEKLNALKQVLPEVFAEGKVDWEKLKATLGEDINFSNERYVLNWAGKSEAFKVLQAPTTKTLAPAKDESVNFDETEHIFIEGENLEVLKVLQKSYFGKVKMIYIDPPYNTGNDSFIYPDKFSETKSDYEKRVGDKDEEGYLTKDGMFKKNSKENGQYHSNWLNMMMPRLYLAKNLLKQDGVIFISIDDHEAHNLRLLMNEIFGEENFVASIVWRKKYGIQNDAKYFSISHEYLLCYAKQKEEFKPNLLERTEEQNNRYKNPDNDTRGVWKSADLSVGRETEKDRYTITTPSGRKVEPPKGRSWVVSEKKFKEMVADNRIWFGESGNNVPSVKKFLTEVKQGITPTTFWDYDEVGHTDGSNKQLKELFDGNSYFDYPKPTEYIKQITAIGSNANDFILDFFSGSGSTAHAVMALNAEDGGSRKCISVQLPEKCDEKSEAFKAGYKTIADIAKERIRRAAIEIAKEKVVPVKSKKTQQTLGLDLGTDSISSIKTTTETETTTFKNTSVKNQDLGFKVLKLSDSNFKQWQQITGKDKQALEEQMKLFVDPVAENASTENMVYELLLKSGKDLNSTISHVSTGSTPEGFYAINETELVLLLEIANQKIIDAVIASNPQKVIALDKLFKGNDQLKTNASLQMKDAGIEFKTI